MATVEVSSRFMDRGGALDPSGVTVDNPGAQPPTPRTQLRASFDSKADRFSSSLMGSISTEDLTEGTADSLPSQKPQPSPHSAEKQRSALVEQRLQAARAMYQSEDLILEDIIAESKQTKEQMVLPSPAATVTIANHSRTPSSRRGRSSDPRKPSSPSSTSKTSMVSGTSNSLSKGQPAMSSAHTVESREASVGTRNTKKSLRGRSKTPDPRRRNRSKTPDNKRGFFRKIFSKKKKEGGSIVTTEVAPVMPVDTSASANVIMPQDDMSTLTSPTWESKNGKNEQNNMPWEQEAFPAFHAPDPFTTNFFNDPDGLLPKQTIVNDDPPAVKPSVDESQDFSVDPPLFLQNMANASDTEESGGQPGYPEVAPYHLEEKKDEFEIPPPPPGEPKKRRKKGRSLRKKAQKKMSTSKEQDPPEEHKLHDSDTGELVGGLTVASAARLNAMSVALMHKEEGQPSPRKTWRQHPVATEDVDFSPHEVVDASASSASSLTGPGPTDRKTKNRRDAPTKSDISAWRDQPLSRNVELTSLSVKRGFQMLRENRESAIARGTAHRVVPVPSPNSKTRPKEAKFEEPEPVDPIQRAGRRLLAKAAVPIQAVARSYLAQQEAVDRMWALIELQSYARRWRAEAYRQSNIASATAIQAVARGHRVRQQLEDQHAAATTIQRIMRGHIASKETFEAVYRIILIQARVRGIAVRQEQALEYVAAATIQAAFRGGSTRTDLASQIYCATIAQAYWRRYASMKIFRQTIAAITIQSKWRVSVCVDAYTNFLAARRIQAAWRGFDCYTDYTRYVASSRIQAAWRGFHCYTDYIFALVDIMVLQRSFRRFLAQREVESMRRNAAATKIQSLWRRAKCQTDLLFDFVNLILSQAVVRRFLCRNVLKQKRADLAFRGEEATKIQAAWRGFWSYSHFVIVQYETVRLQAIARGNITRSKMHIQLGCAIMVQSAVRRHLAMCKARRVQAQAARIASMSMSLRESNACKNIQFWWRVVLECRQEKNAALIIERFFMMVRAEVERETERVLLKKQMKKEKKRLKKKMAQEKLVEKVWMNTLDENNVEVFHMSQSESMLSPASTAVSAAPMHKNRLSGFGRHRASSPANNMAMRYYGRESSDDASEVSGMSSVLSLGFNRAQMRKTGFPKESKEDDDATLEEAFRDLETPRREESSASKYKKKYGLQTAPNRSANQSRKFFADDVGSALAAASDVIANSKGRKSTSSVPASRSESGTPRAPKTPTDHASAYRKAKGYQHKTSPGLPPTPKGRVTPTGQRSSKFMRSANELDKEFGAAKQEFGMI